MEALVFFYFFCQFFLWTVHDGFLFYSWNCSGQDVNSHDRGSSLKIYFFFCFFGTYTLMFVLDLGFLNGGPEGESPMPTAYLISISDTF